MLNFNLPGIFAFAVAFGIALAIGHVAGITAEGPLMMIAGPLCIAFDLICRARQPERSWFHPDSGGALFIIPMWILGCIWLVLGIIYTIQQIG